MGLTHVTVAVAPVGGRRKTWKGLFLVDSGAIDTLVPGRALRELGIRPYKRDTHEMADGTAIELDVGSARITVKDETVTADVLFGPDDAEPLLGAITIQAAGLHWDARHEHLTKSRVKPLKYRRKR